jgi:hypothetical protein
MSHPRRGTIVIVSGDAHVVDDVYPGTADCKLCGNIHTNYQTRPLFTHAGSRTQGCQVRAHRSSPGVS